MKFTTAQWVAWIGATLTACIGLTSFAYQNFETKDSANEKKSDFVLRLTRIEDKLDRVIEERK